MQEPEKQLPNRIFEEKMYKALVSDVKNLQRVRF